MDSRPVPKVLHQTWLTGDPPADAAGWIARARVIAEKNAWKYEWWTRARCLAELPGYEAAERPACTVQYQADVARWLILREHGGLYLDCDVELCRLPRELAGAWVQGIGLGEQNGAAIAAPAGHRWMADTLAAAEREPAAWRRRLCGGTYFQTLAMGPDVQLWPVSAWNWEGRYRGYGWHHGQYLRWHSTRPREE